MQLLALDPHALSLIVIALVTRTSKQKKRSELPPNTTVARRRLSTAAGYRERIVGDRQGRRERVPRCSCDVCDTLKRVSISRECPVPELPDFYRTRGRAKLRSLHRESRAPNGVEFHGKSALFVFSYIDDVWAISGIKIE